MQKFRRDCQLRLRRERGVIEVVFLSLFPSPRRGSLLKSRCPVVAYTSLDPPSRRASPKRRPERSRPSLSLSQRARRPPFSSVQASLPAQASR